ncbi:MAG: hypothetical protein ACRDTR_01430 [Rubrobacter sp.]
MYGAVFVAVLVFGVVVVVLVVGVRVLGAPVLVFVGVSPTVVVFGHFVASFGWTLLQRSVPLLNALISPRVSKSALHRQRFSGYERA